MSHFNKRYLYILFIVCLLALLRFNGTIIIEDYFIRYLILIIISVGLLLLALDSFSITIFPLKVLSAISFGILFFVSLFFVVFTTAGVLKYFEDNHDDPGFRCIKTIYYENRRFKAYRTNEGAMTNFGMVVREEKTIIPGIITVNTLVSEYPMDTIGLSINGNNLIITNMDNNNEIKVVALH